MSRTGQVIVSRTQLEDAARATQVKVETGLGMTIVSTIAVPNSSTVPVAVEGAPATGDVYASGFVVNTTPGTRTVALHLNARQLAEQERVRKLNEAIRRSIQG